MSGTGTAGEQRDVAGGVVPTKSPTIGSGGVPQRSRLERAFDPLMWAWCWLAYVIVVHALPEAHTYPDWRQRVVDRVQLWLLPFAGYYGYATQGHWRWSERRR